MDLSGVAEGGYLYIHKGCLEWSSAAETKFNPSQQPMDKDGEKSPDECDEPTKALVVAALMRKCTFCMRFGASILCRVNITFMNL